MKITPLILCGGAGTRLWPSSNDLSPKQLLTLVESQSLFAGTLKRVSGAMFDHPIIVTAARLAEVLNQQLRTMAAEPANILLEPEARNTAAAIALAVFAELAQCRDPLFLTLPSDHVIRERAAFEAAVTSGIEAAQKGDIVTFGIRPRWAETGYGYIEAAPSDDGAVLEVLRFAEKPNSETAQSYLEGGRHFWNTGIFLFRASAMADQLRLYACAVARSCEAAIVSAETDGRFIIPGAEAFLSCPSISIDYAVLERTNRLSMVETDMDWSDVGSWDAVWEISDKDERGNALFGNVEILNSSGCLVRNETDRPLAAIDCKDFIIVVTPSGSLVVPRGSSQSVKAVVEGSPPPTTLSKDAIGPSATG